MENTSNETQEQQLKYKDLISQSTEDQQSEQLELDVQVAKSQLEVDIAQTKVDLAKAKVKFAETQRANPYSVQSELAAKGLVDSLQEGLNYAQKVLTERF